MRVLVGEQQRGPVAALIALATSVVLLAGTAASDYSAKAVAPVIVLAVIFIVAWRTLFSWRSLLALLIGVILFIPIKRYTLPVNLPFHLEIYRIVVALLCAAWLSSALIDPRVRLRRSAFDRPLVVFVVAIAASLLANTSRVGSLGQEVLKRVMFFASFIIVYYIVVSLIRRRRDIDFLVSMLAGGGAVVAAFALFEWRTGYDVFNHLSSVFPVLRQAAADVTLSRGGRLRVSASAQHPIALGAALVMLVPLAVYRAKASGLTRWWFAAALIVLGALSTGSRTGMTMLLAVVVVFAILRFHDVKRLWPALLPLVLAVHFALPGTIGSIRSAFFPKGGLIAQENKNNVGAGRLATLGPALHTEWRPHFAFGEGFQTRVTVPDDLVPVANGPILDDQWLGVFLETGLFGGLSLVWLFVHSVRRMMRVAREDSTSLGWLATSLAAAVTAYAIGMLTYDAFSFIQVTFLLFIMLGMGSAVVTLHRAAGHRREPARARRTASHLAN